ncbi:hypothetical protein ACJZ2D_000030 [Fusarium nematophilum]
MPDHDVPDSTDWLSTPLSGLAAVENALRCQVCKDFFKTPMITSCSHTFCSLCIRRALSNDGKCPLCRTSEQELKLRSNWSMEETVDAFVKARSATLELAQDGGVGNAVSKRKIEDSQQDLSDGPEGKRQRKSARLRQSQADTSSMVLADYDELIKGPDDDDYLLEPEDGLVPCPVCQTRMKDWQVFKHLETCPGPAPPPQRNAGTSSSSSFGRQQRQQTKALERLPALNYSMFKEQALRKKMSELGISNQGPRALLERRHKEWMMLWNANCDAAQPKKRRELLHDLDVWERTQGGKAATLGRTAQSAVTVKDKEFDGAAWAAKHDTSFKDLIASARKSRLEAKKKVEEASNELSAREPTVTTQPYPSKPVQTPTTTNHAEDTAVPAVIQLEPHSNGNLVQSTVAKAPSTRMEQPQAAPDAPWLQQMHKPYPYHNLPHQKIPQAHIPLQPHPASSSSGTMNPPPTQPPYLTPEDVPLDPRLLQSWPGDSSGRP